MPTNVMASVAEQLERLIAHEVADKAIPSISYVLVDREQILASGHVRRADLTHPLNDKSAFRIGSLTKTFTAICLMQLAEQGLVDIDADVSAYIPHFHPENPFASNDPGPFGAQVTLRKLMSHTAGIVREPKSGHYLDANRPSLADTVDELAVSTLKNDPSLGTFAYSNAGIAVVGSVVERMTGEPFTDYVTRHVFQPLGMNDTAIRLTPAVRDVLAPAWMWTIDGDEPAPVFDLGGSPAGNIYSTLPDMGRYVSALLRGGFAEDGTPVISPASLQRMWVPAGKRPEGYGGNLAGYGLGFGTGETDGFMSVGHGGAVYGYATQMTIMPTAGLGIVVFATLDFANQIASRLSIAGLRLALEARHMGKAPAPIPASLPITPTQLANLPGHYRNADGGEVVEVKAKGDALYLMGDGVPLQIKPLSATQFVIDGRIYGAGASYPHLDVAFPAEGQLHWKGQDWTRLAALPDEPAPADIAPHLGEYGPDFNITYLTYRDGGLKCLIEYFCTHSCEPVSPGHFKMHGLLYEDEILELGAVDETGQRGIRVGPMFLARRG